jgi:hypothetical protein
MEWAWWVYFWDEARWERRVSQRRRNSVLRWCWRQNWKASWQTVYGRKVSKENQGKNQSTNLVENLETGVVTEDVEGSAVRLPEESEPGSDETAVGAVAGLLLGNGSEEDRLGRFGSLEVLDLGSDTVGRLLLLDGTLELVDLGERLGELVAGELEELLDGDLDGRDRGVLGNVLIEDETVLGGAALAEVDGELEELDHDRLEDREGGGAEALGGEDLGDGREGGHGLPDGEQLIRAL